MSSASSLTFTTPKTFTTHPNPKPNRLGHRTEHDWLMGTDTNFKHTYIHHENLTADMKQVQPNWVRATQLMSTESDLHTPDLGLDTLPSQIVDDIETISMWAGQHGAIFVGAPTGEAVVLMMTPYWSGVFTSLSPHVTRSESKPRLNRVQKIALVTDSVITVVGKGFSQPSFVKLVKFRDIAPDELRKVYQDLFTAEFDLVISLHLSPQLGRSYLVAKTLVDEFNDQLHVIDSRCNGLGLSMLVKAVSQAIQTNASGDIILRYLNKLIARRSYFAYVDEMDEEKNAFWIDQLTPAKKSRYDSNPKHSLVSIHNEIDLIDTFLSRESALQHLYTTIKSEVRKRRSPKVQVGIEFNGAYTSAKYLKERVKAKFGDTVEVHLHICGYRTKKLFGDTIIGVCVL